MEKIDHVCYNIRNYNKGFGPLIRFKGSKYLWYTEEKSIYSEIGRCGDYRNSNWAGEYLRIDNNDLLQILYGVTQDEIDYMYSLDM